MKARPELEISIGFQATKDLNCKKKRTPVLSSGLILPIVLAMARKEERLSNFQNVSGFHDWMGS